MGTVHPIGASRETVSLGQAVAAYLDTLSGAESAGTRRTYGARLRALLAEHGTGCDVSALDPPAVAAWFTARWQDKAPSTWNTALDALRSAASYWRDQGWIRDDPTSLLRRRRRAADRARALSRDDVERLLGREDIAIRERTLWRLLYESAARAGEVLALDVADLDMPNRRAKVTRKGSAVDVITWRTGTARLLPRLLRGRKAGPVFLTARKARVQLPPGDIDAGTGRARLSYRQAAGLFEDATRGYPGGPWTLHQLRHSALTHAAEDGASTSTLLAYSGHTSVASLARYARVSPEALGRWQAQRDPARRR
jgi:integrase